MVAMSDVGLIQSQLRAMRLPPGAPVLVHASLRRVGLGLDGAPALYQGLLDHARGGNTAVILPAFTYQCEDPAAWVNPLLPRDQIPGRRALTPAFDPLTTPVNPEIGFMAEYVRRQPGTRRSDHPVLSFTAIGPQAGAAVAGQGLNLPLGSASPLGWLVDQHGAVLLVGTGLAAMTLLHLAETTAPISYVRSSRCRARTKQGWTWFWGSPGDGRDFAKAGSLLSDATVGRGRIGHADALVIDAAAFTSAARDRLSDDPGWLLCDDPACPFCALARRYLAGEVTEIVYGEQGAAGS